MTIMSGIDDETWLFHLRKGDYSQWFENEIKDEELINEARAIETMQDLSPADSRKKLQALISERYTLPA